MNDAPKKEKDKDLTRATETAVQPLEMQNGRVLPERSKRRENRLPDPYFTKLAKGTRYLRYAVTVLMVLFTVAMAFIFSNEITGEKLKLLMRNASFSFPGEEVHYTTVRYDADRVMAFAPYREYFAVATGSGLRLYDHRGNVALQEKTTMSDPVIDSGSDYVLTYDREGKNYLVCNSVTALYEGSENFPIYAADVCDNGRYMILTSSSTYLCVMKIYNRSFKLVKEISVDRYPVAAQLSDDGARLLLLSASNGGDGRLIGHIAFYDLSGEAKLTGEIKTNDLPLYGALTPTGAAVLFEDRVTFFGSAGTDHGSVRFEGKKAEHFCFSEKYAAVSFETDSVTGNNEILICDLEKEELLKRLPFVGRISGLTVVRDLLFTVERERTTAYDLATGNRRVMVVNAPERILEGSGETIFFCYRDKAENVRESVELTELLGALPPRNEQKEENETAA